MSGVVRPSAISFERTEKVPRPGGDPLRHGQRAARPFQAGTDPDLLWLGRTQQRILDRLESGVLAREGVLLLTGDVGTGKTILAKALLQRLPADTLIATVLYAQHDPLDFWKGIGEAWGAGGHPDTSGAFHSRLPALLDDAAARKKRVLLFVDEAQALSQDLLTEIGRLAVMAGEPGRGQARLSILLVGQDELGVVVLARPENAALAKRVGVRCVTAPLTDVEIREYIAHQLKVTGTEGPAFTAEALREIVAASQGIPRLINTIADLALRRGSQQGVPAIGLEVVRQCARSLGHPPGLVDRSGPRRARAPTRTRQTRTRNLGRRAALYVPILVLPLAIAGYLYDSGRSREARREPGTSALPAAPPSSEGPTSGGVAGLIQPTRASDAPPPATPDREPRAPDGPAPPTVERSPKRQVVSAPEPLPAPAVRRPPPAAVGVTEERQGLPEANPPSASRNQEAPTAPPLGGARRSREVRASEDSDAVDPAGIIDWVLSEYPARTQ